MLKCVPQLHTGILLTFKKFTKLLNPGLHFYLPSPIQTLHIVSNKKFEKQFSIPIRTLDKVFPQLDISLQCKIAPQDTYKAYFQLEDPIRQMLSYSSNIIRKQCSGMTLDEIFESQNQISDSILYTVGPVMKKTGYTIQSAQIKNIIPPKGVLNAMNEINQSQRRKIAVKNEGQAAKIRAVLMAQADAKQKQLRGAGIAALRQNITRGWTQSILEMANKTETKPKDVMHFMLSILQQQTLQNMSKNAGTKVIFTDQKLSTIQSFQAK